MITHFNYNNKTIKRTTYRKPKLVNDIVNIKDVDYIVYKLGAGYINAKMFSIAYLKLKEVVIKFMKEEVCQKNLMKMHSITREILNDLIINAVDKKFQLENGLEHDKQGSGYNIYTIES